LSNQNRPESYDVGILGQGYVGLELASSLANSGLTILGLDLDKSRIEMIQSGKSPVENVSDSELSTILNSSYFASTQMEAISLCKTVVICVPTPILKNGDPDLSFLSTAVEFISDNVSPGTLVINESTSFPGTLRSVIEKPIKLANNEIADSLFFAVAPERISPGDSIPLKEVSRVVSGTSSTAKSKVLEFYSRICGNVVMVDSPEIAEMAKLLENSFRQINIAFVNELSLLCRKTDIPINKVIQAASTKPYGFMPFYPSSGIGGHCIPVDPMYLKHFADQNQMQMRSVEVAHSSNQAHPIELCKLILREFPSSVVLRILLIGVSYKPGVTDTRETPAQSIVNYLRSQGHEVFWHDLLVEEWNGERRAELDQIWDIVIFNTPHPGIDRTRFSSGNTKIFDFGFSQESIEVPHSE
jgi:UDP-N-acetyl-D-glucosamine dehydrogenase